MRQDMMASSKDFWGKIDKDFANFDAQVRETISDRDLHPMLPLWAMSGDLRTEMMPSNSNRHEVIKVKQDDKKFEVAIDVSDYKPEEIKVTTVDNELRIEGKHEQHKEDKKNAGGEVSSFVMKQFSRKWTLPKDVDPKNVVSNLSSDGLLMVTAPRQGAAITHEVQIQKAVE